MTHAVLLTLCCGSIAVALIAVGLAVYAVRSTSTARSMAHQHPRPDDRRQRDQGPPEGIEDRRRHRAPADLGRARRRDVDDPQWHTTQQPDGEEEAYPPRPVPRPVEDRGDPTDAAPRDAAAATTDMRTLPPPGSIRGAR